MISYNTTTGVPPLPSQIVVHDMKITFLDLQHDDNPRNGQVLGNHQSILALLDELRGMSTPFMCQFIGDNGHNLTVGIGGDFGCVQYASNDGTPPYLMAYGTSQDHRDMEFQV